MFAKSEHKYLRQFVIKFLAVYFILYYGTLAVIGLTIKGGYYSQFIHDHLDYITWLRRCILRSSGLFVIFLVILLT